MKDAVSTCLEQLKNNFGKYPKFVQFDQGTDSVNRSIKTRPDSVNESNWTEVWKALFSHDLGEPPEPKFAIGESVRISKYKSVFTKGYKANFTEEIFTVMEVYHAQSNTYTIKDSAGEPIIGRFYEQELYGAEGSQPDFKIEKELRRRTVKGKKMAFVKWLGYGTKFNSWIPAEDIKSIT
ncbi:uncharacterized transposon-derived [Paramuricea clavata]|uniref:Uncharacterized transposon-derived n=1 Tax=Paramuricea clavata TaxID=317549 RepID=A0A7D9HZQ9_PARCT|nr:uncharacterized transposon-derived [Paramuricea clavata]